MNSGGTSYTAGTGISISSNVISCTLNGLSSDTIKPPIYESTTVIKTPSGGSWYYLFEVGESGEKFAYKQGSASGSTKIYISFYDIIHFGICFKIA